MRKPDRTARKEHRGESDIERKRRVIAPAEAAADIGKLRVDAPGLERRARFAQEIGDRLRRLVRGLHAEHELEGAVARVIPDEPTLGLEKHRVHRLGLEFALEHQEVRLVILQLCAGLLTVVARLWRTLIQGLRPTATRPEAAYFARAADSPSPLGLVSRCRERQGLHRRCG